MTGQIGARININNFYIIILQLNQMNQKVQSQSMNSPQSHLLLFKVKVFSLKDDFEDEEGVGYFEFTKKLNQKTYQIEDFITVRMPQHIRSQADRPGNFSLQSKITKNKQYEKQQDLIIRWWQAELQKQIALSFRNRPACEQQWFLLCHKIGKNPHEIMTKKPQYEIEMPTKQNLRYIWNIAEKQPEIIHFHILNKTEFFIRLTTLLNQFEKDLNQNGRKCVFEIGRAILRHCHEKTIFLKLFSTTFFSGIFSILKYYNKSICKYDYVALYNQQFKLKNVLQLGYTNNENIQAINRMKFTAHVLWTDKNAPEHRLFQQVINSQFLEVWNQILKLNKIQKIVQLCKQDLDTAVLIVQDLLLNLSKVEDKRCKQFIFQSLYDQNLVGSLVRAIYTSQVESQRIRVLQIILWIGVGSPHQFGLLLQETSKNEHSIGNIIVEALGSNMKDLRRMVVLYVEAILNASLERKPFGKILVFEVLLKLAESISRSCNEPAFPSFLELTSIIMQYCQCRVGHILRQFNFIEKIFKAATNKQNQLLVIRILKHIVNKPSIIDNELAKQLVNNRIMDWICDLLVKNNNKNNILSSAILECFRFISQHKHSVFLFELQHSIHLLPQTLLVRQLTACISECQEERNREFRSLLSENEQGFNQQVRRRNPLQMFDGQTIDLSSFL